MADAEDSKSSDFGLVGSSPISCTKTQAMRLGFVLGGIMKKYIMILCSMLVLTACGSTATEPESSEEVTVEDSVEMKTVDEEPEEPVEIPFDITLGFAGDINFADDYLPVQHYNEIGASSISDVISPYTIETMQNMNLMWINNEFCYSEGGSPMPGKAYTFRSSPEHVSWLSDMGVDIVGLANNHVYDYGADAFEDTLVTLKGAGIPYVGAGRNLTEAMTPVYFQVNLDGTYELLPNLATASLSSRDDCFIIAYVAASRAEKYKLTPQATETEGGILRCYDNELFISEIQEAKQYADYVIALPHWGTEDSTVLEEAQTEGAREYLAAGADAVIGAHSHILQGIELIDDKPVVYSLGNFWFDYRDEDTEIATIHISGTYVENEELSIEDCDVSLQILPGTQRNYETFLAETDDEKREIFDRIESYSVNVSILDDGTVVERESE